VFEAAAAAAAAATATAAAATVKEAGGRDGRRGKCRRRETVDEAEGYRDDDGDEHAARAPERVCVRLIN